ncbi:unnamed protein product, partial [Didymodactylos carnosus]
MMATYSFKEIAIEYIQSVGDTSKKQVTDLVKDELVELIRRLKSKMNSLEETIQHLTNDLTQSNERNSDLRMIVEIQNSVVKTNQNLTNLLSSFSTQQQTSTILIDILVSTVDKLQQKLDLHTSPLSLPITTSVPVTTVPSSNATTAEPSYLSHVSKYQATVPKQQSTSNLLDSQNSSRKPVKKKEKIHHHLLICDSLGSAIVPSDLSSPSSTTQIRTLHNKTINGATRAINNWEFDS